MRPDRGGRRLRVDWIRCEGFGTCADLLPEVISLDDWGYPVVRPGPLPPDLLDDARRAVDCCPRDALVLEPLFVDGRR